MVAAKWLKCDTSERRECDCVARLLVSSSMSFDGEQFGSNTDKLPVLHAPGRLANTKIREFEFD